MKMKGLPLKRESKNFKKFLKTQDLIKIADTETFQQYMSVDIIIKMKKKFASKKYRKIYQKVKDYLSS